MPCIGTSQSLAAKASSPPRRPTAPGRGHPAAETPGCRLHPCRGLGNSVRRSRESASVSESAGSRPTCAAPTAHDARSWVFGTEASFSPSRGGGGSMRRAACPRAADPTRTRRCRAARGRSTDRHRPRPHACRSTPPRARRMPRTGLRWRRPRPSEWSRASSAHHRRSSPTCRAVPPPRTPAASWGPSQSGPCCSHMVRIVGASGAGRSMPTCM